MPLRAVLFDLDDTVIVDEAVSREAFEAVARYARDKHGAEEARFARDAAEQARVLWAAGPCHAFCRDPWGSAPLNASGEDSKETENLRN